MNNVDKQYLAIMQDILDNGNLKHTRAGDTLSLFGKTMEFDLKEGLPLLTTKKVFYKGAIHELIWFLKGDTNIRYLVDNNVHIWDDDAYRWFKSLDFKSYKVKDKDCIEGFYKFDRCIFELDELDYSLVIVGNNNEEITMYGSVEHISKETFTDCVKNGYKVKRKFIFNGRTIKESVVYSFGDLGPVYGKQWRSFGTKEVDQIRNIIDTLKERPDDRRMLCVAFNPDVLDEVALPPCHVMFQFYTRELDNDERIGIWYNKYNLNEEVFNFEKSDLKEHTKEYQLFKDYFHHKTLTQKELIDIINSEYDIPKRELSLSFNMRSTDWPCGCPFNILSYSVLCHIIANICNMTVGKLVYFGGDVHIYTNQIEGCKEQLSRKGYDKLPKLIMKRKFENIDDVHFDDFEIVDYESEPSIKFPLSVG